MIDTAFEKARALDVAQKTSDACASTEASASLTAIGNTSEIPWTHSVSAVSHRASTCFFCGSQVRHNRKKCPARDAVCYKCQKGGHYSKVCKRDQQKAPSRTVSASVFQPIVCAIQQVPDCLSFAVTEAVVGDIKLSVLTDPGSLLSYVNEGTAKTLCLSTHKSSTLKLSMAVDSPQGTISRHCFV